MRLLLTIALALAAICGRGAGAATITNDTFWKATNGSYIFSQGGGIFRFPDPTTGEEHYYWYGVKYQEAIDYTPAALAGSKSNNTTFVAVTCYESDDLVNWKFKRDVITTATFSGHDWAWWIGRLGVAYVAEAGKYALFVQYNDKVGVFTCPTPTGNFHYHQQIDMTAMTGKSNTGDQTVFTDTDGQSYLCYSYGSGRSKIYISKIGVVDGMIGLADCHQIYKGTGREGDCMFRHGDKYYVCASDLYGWNASNVYYLTADNIYGPYTPTNDMQKMPGAEEDYGHVTQTGFFVTVHGSEEETVVYCGDRWAGFAGNGNGFNQWCPITFDDGKPRFHSLSQWSLDVATGLWEVGPENNYVRSGSFDADRVKIPSTNKPAQTYLKGWNFRVDKGNTIAQGSADSPVLNEQNSKADRATVQGNRCLNFYDKTAYARKVWQTIKTTARVPLEDGTYRLRCFVKSGSNFGQLYAYATSGGQTFRTDMPYSDSQWHEVVVEGVAVSGGQVEVGFYADGSAEAWARIDDVSLVRTDGANGIAAPKAATATATAANAADRAYTLAGLPATAAMRGLVAQGGRLRIRR